MSAKRKKRGSAINDLIEVMERLRAPDGCPWDREQDHKSIRFHAVEEVYELIDAIEMDDDDEMLEECGDLLLQVVFHCQLAKERNAFDFEKAARSITDKLIRRHPHVFGDSDADNVDAVWAQWEKIKREEKKGTQHERPSVLDGIPRHLPALQRAEKLVKKARKNGLSKIPLAKPIKQRYTKASLSKELFALAEYAQNKGWQPEALLRAETKKQEKALRKKESRISK
ncbi:MAG: MazG family protein [Opitutia bacterium TMED67]|nr:MazG family protein [Verrucomicrobiales bacterium]OUU77725.1 MAG: MazG family protein [Opitutae bacterium TMED67]RZO61250.1 MAG: MazG family protein [Limisphaerales bacterium]|tara:strand:+ start:2735 stop:3415 length:681 start_codon:yes stop_codon:yes gene_type:complete